MERTNVSAPYPVAQAGSLYRGRLKHVLRALYPPVAGHPPLGATGSKAQGEAAYCAAGALSLTRVNENDDDSQTFLHEMRRGGGGG